MAEAYPSRKFPDVLLTVPPKQDQMLLHPGIQLGGEKPTGVKFLVSTLKRRNSKASTSTSYSPRPLDFLIYKNNSTISVVIKR